MIDTEKLRKKILNLAIRGKLVQQDPTDEPVSELLMKIMEEKRKLVAGGKPKNSDIESGIFKHDNSYFEKSGQTIRCIDEEIPFAIPKNWIWVRLKQLYIIRNGFTPLRSNKDFWENGSVPWFTIQDIDEQGSIITRTKQKINSIALSSLERMVPKDSLLLCCTASIGRFAYTKIALTTNQQFNGISLKDEFGSAVHTEYLYWIAGYFQEILHEKAGATTFEFVSVGKVGSILIPIPPINEQLRIIKQMQASYNIVQNIDENQIILSKISERLKSKVLTIAMEGKLSPKIDISNFISRSLSQTITQDYIGDGNWILSEDMDENGNINLIQLGNIGHGFYKIKPYKKINNKTFTTLKCTEISANTLLINRLINGQLDCAIFESYEGKFITSVDVCWIKENPNIDLVFLMYLLLSNKSQKYIVENSSGTTRLRISKKKLIEIPFSIPNITNQKIITEILIKYFKAIDAIIRL